MENNVINFFFKIYYNKLTNLNISKNIKKIVHSHSTEHM